MIVSVLLARGATVDARDGQGRTPLMAASEFGRSDVVDMLLTAGADPAAVDQKGKTALHLAAGSFWANASDRLGALIQLLNRGANPNARDADGMTPLAAALQRGRGDLADLLREHGGEE